MSHIIAHDHIEKKILAIRGKEVILDRDLAVLYDVETRALKQAVRRNMDRFPPDFMFELTNEEIDELVSQSVIPSFCRGDESTRARGGEEQESDA